MFLAALLLMIQSSISNNAYAIVSDPTDPNVYKKAYESKVRPFFDSEPFHSFVGKDGIKIAYKIFKAPQEKARIVLLPGRTESIQKYAEVIYDLLVGKGLRDMGYSIYVMDHRGQGESERLISNPHMQYVDSYKDFVVDLETFMDTIVGPTQNVKQLLLAHSMGGAIGTLYMWQHPKVFSAAVLSSPMFEINTAPFPKLVAVGLAEMGCAFGAGKTFAPTQGGYVPFETFKLNDFTSCLDRYTMTEQGFVDAPETQMGGASYQFIRASFHATDKIAKISSLSEIPLLIFQAEKDKVVNPEGQNNFCANAKNCKLVQVPGAEHEVLMEVDSIRNNVLDQITDYLKSF